MHSGIKYFLIFTGVCAALFGAAGDARAQVTGVDASSPSGRGRQEEEIPKSIRESMMKKMIEREQKEFEETIKRGEEVAKLSDELTAAVEAGRDLSLEDRKKLERIEKLVKKIRNDIGGEDDDEADAPEKPSTLKNMIESLKENSASLLSALKKTTRQTISAVAIESSNSVLRLLKFMRFTQANRQ